MRFLKRSQTCSRRSISASARLRDVRHLAVGGVAGLLLVGGLGAFAFEAGELVLEVAGDRGDVGVAVVDQLLLLDVVLNLEVGQFLVAGCQRRRW